MKILRFIVFDLLLWSLVPAAVFFEVWKSGHYINFVYILFPLTGIFAGQWAARKFNRFAAEVSEPDRILRKSANSGFMILAFHQSLWIWTLLPAKGMFAAAALSSVLMFIFIWKSNRPGDSAAALASLLLSVPGAFALSGLFFFPVQNSESICNMPIAGNLCDSQNLLVPGILLLSLLAVVVQPKRFSGPAAGLLLCYAYLYHFSGIAVMSSYSTLALTGIILFFPGKSVRTVGIWVFFGFVLVTICMIWSVFFPEKFYSPVYRIPVLFIALAAAEWSTWFAQEVKLRF